MKNLKIGLGGHPLTGDDGLYLQDGLHEGLMKFIEAFVGTFCIITGVDASVSGGTITWTAGWIYMAGEFLQVDAGSAVYAANDCFVIVETYDALGDVVYADFNTEQTYAIRKATISGTTSGYNVFSAKRMKQWRDVHMLPFAVGSNWTTTGAAALYTLSLTGDVIVRGQIGATYNAGADSVIAVLPVGFRPVDNVTVCVAAIVNGTKVMLHLSINAGGTIAPIGLTGGDVVTIYLGNIVLLR